MIKALQDKSKHNKSNNLNLFSDIKKKDIEKKKKNLSHYLPSIKKHFISLSKSIVGHTRLLFTLDRESKCKIQIHLLLL